MIHAPARRPVISVVDATKTADDPAPNERPPSAALLEAVEFALNAEVVLTANPY